MCLVHHLQGMMCRHAHTCPVAVPTLSTATSLGQSAAASCFLFLFGSMMVQRGLSLLAVCSWSAWSVFCPHAEVSMCVLQGWGVGSLPRQREWLICSDQHNKASFDLHFCTGATVNLQLQLRQRVDARPCHGRHKIRYHSIPRCISWL